MRAATAAALAACFLLAGLPGAPGGAPAAAGETTGGAAGEAARGTAGGAAGGAAGKAGEAAEATTGMAAVSIDNFSFAPAEIVVPAGTTVVWTNRDDIPHTVTGGAKASAFRSEPLDTDGQFSFRFDHAGRYPYFCSLHAHMQGVVVVQ